MITLQKPEIQSAVPMQLKDINNLIRLVHFWTLRERSATILHFKRGGKHIMGTMTSLPAFFNHRGLPLFLYVEVDEGPKGPFIKYRSDPEEEWDYAKGTFDRKWLYIPLIALEKIPVFLEGI